MQDLVIELLKSVNAIQIVAMGIITWFFYSRLNEKTDKNKDELRQEADKNKNELKQEIEKNKSELKQEIEKNKNELRQEAEKNKNELRQEAEKNKNELKQEANELKQEIEKLGVKVEDIDRRLCRIEGSLATHGHCLFNQKQSDRKAE